METAPCVSGVGPSGTTGRSLHRWAFRQVLKLSATCCSLWTTIHSGIWTKAMVGNWEQDLVWWCSTKDLARICPLLPYRRGFTRLSSIRRVLWEEWYSGIKDHQNHARPVTKHQAETLDL